MKAPTGQRQQFRFHAMGGPCTLDLYSEDAAHLQRVGELAQQEVLRLEAKYSRYREDSVASEINRYAAQGGVVEVDAETAALLDYAETAWEQSEGLFDITSGLLRLAWQFDQQALPEQSRIEALLPRIGWQKLQWRAPELAFEVPGMQLDFGGYVKEYAADCVAGLCRQQGVEAGLIELGGDIHVIGPHPEGSPWMIGIRDPRAPETALATIPVAQGGVASSGDYERFMIVGGQRYCHILNPKTGWPAQGLAAVSVQAPQCLIAGTSSTIAMLMGESGVAWLDTLGLPFIAISASGEIFQGD